MGAQTLSQVAVAAFPFEYRAGAQAAAEMLEPFVDSSYRQRSIGAQLLGRPVNIPYRIHFHESIASPAPAIFDRKSLAAACLQTRSTDGYMRHTALRAIVDLSDPVTVAFVVLLAGEYVVEIIQDIVAAIPTLERHSYANFVRENRRLIPQLRAKATSYWDCYYRTLFPQRRNYPGLAFLREIEVWAA